MKAVKLLAVFICIGVTFWALFYSTLTANILFTIPLRNWYQDIYWKVEGLIRTPIRKYPPFDPIYTFTVQLPKGDSYQLQGKFKNIDTKNGIISVKGYDQKIYRFQIGYNLIKIDNGMLSNFIQSDISDNKVEKVATKNSIIAVDNKPYTSESRITIQWDDKRSLWKILQDYSKSPTDFLNKDSVGIFVFIKRD